LLPLPDVEAGEVNASLDDLNGVNADVKDDDDDDDDDVLDKDSAAAATAAATTALDCG
jgi:hypothetical protein